MITLVMVFGLFCNTSLWAGNGSSMKDGSMLDADLTTTEIVGTVSDAGSTGTGLTIVEESGEVKTIFGMGSLSYWDSLGVAKPTVGETVTVDAVNITFKDGSTRWIAISLTIFSENGDETVDLRDEYGTPLWRGSSKLKGTYGTGDCTACPNSGTCDKTQQGGGTGTCPLVD